MATNNEYNRQQLLAADANEDPSPEEIYAMIQASAEHRARTDSQFQPGSWLGDPGARESH